MCVYCTNPAAGRQVSVHSLSLGPGHAGSRVNSLHRLPTGELVSAGDDRRAVVCTGGVVGEVETVTLAQQVRGRRDDVTDADDVTC